MATRRWRRLVLPVLLVPLLALAAVRAGDPPKDPPKETPKASGQASEEFKQAGRELLRDVKAAGRDVRDSKAGRYVEDAGRELGRDADGASRKGWEKTKSFSSSAADEVRRATREFWDDVIRTKQAMAEKLRKENSELKAKKAEAAPRSEPAKEIR